MNVWKFLVGLVAGVAITRSISLLEHFLWMRNAVMKEIKQQQSSNSIVHEAKTIGKNADNDEDGATTESIKKYTSNLPSNVQKDETKETLSTDVIDASLQDKNNGNAATVVISYINNSGLDRLARDFFKGSTCSRLLNGTNLEEYNQHDTLVNVSFSCNNLFQYSDLGSGNYISAFYGMRMVAETLGNKTSVNIQCSDAFETRRSLILPWVMGSFPKIQKPSAVLPTMKEACSDYKSIPIGYLWHDMRFEMRRMAIAMVGIPSPDHPSATWAKQHLWRSNSVDNMQLPTPQPGNEPLFPNTELDDAMLHFRCGDLIHTNHPSFGFMKFGSFARHLSPHVQTIGIATQPFDSTGTQQRRSEGGKMKRKRCKQVVMAFVDFLSQKFPNATIRVHNGLNETIALTFARMIMANQTVVGITSFGVFPGVSTFGTGYVRKPDYPKAPNRWLLNIPYKMDNVKLIEEPKIMAPAVKKGWGENGSKIIEWFQNYSMPPL